MSATETCVSVLENLMAVRCFHESAFIVSELRLQGFGDDEITQALHDLLCLRHRREWIEGEPSEWWWILPVAGADLPSWRAKVGPDVRARLDDLPNPAHISDEGSRE
jgi:hypothetical protein